MVKYLFPYQGVLAQLGERNAGSVEVRGSIPLHSTKKSIYPPILGILEILKIFCGTQTWYTQRQKMHLLKRDGTYYFRQRIPAYFDMNKETHIKVSLRTKTLKIAKLRATSLSFKLNNLFVKGQVLDVVSIKAVINAYVKEALEEYSDLETMRHNALKFVDSTGKEYGGHTPEAIDKELTILQELSYSDNVEKLEEKAQTILPRTNISNDFLDSLNGREREIFNHELIKGEFAILKEDKETTLSKFEQPKIEYVKIDNADFNKEFVDKLESRLGKNLSETILSNFATTQKTILFNDAINDYIKLESVNKNWVSKTKDSNHRKLLVALELIGNCPLNQLDRDAFENFRVNLLKLPANFNKLPQFKNKTLSNIINSKEEYKAISRATANEYIVVLTAFFQWAKLRDYTRENYAQSLKVKEPQRNAMGKRYPFESDDIKNIFNEISKIKNDKPHLYFVTLIGFYNGFRLNEICQLHMSDIKNIDGLWCFDINDNPNSKGEKVKSLKNEPTKRVVPIHPTLIKLGFMEYYENTLKKREERLFYQLSYSRDGYGKNVIYLFNKLKKEYFPNTKKSFHSTRHSFIDILKKLYGSDVKRKALTGRAYNDVDHDNYGNPVPPRDLIEDLEKVTYSEIF